MGLSRRERDRLANSFNKWDVKGALGNKGVFGNKDVDYLLKRGASQGDINYIRRQAHKKFNATVRLKPDYANKYASRDADERFEQRRETPKPKPKVNAKQLKADIKKAANDGKITPKEAHTLSKSGANSKQLNKQISRLGNDVKINKKAQSKLTNTPSGRRSTPTSFKDFGIKTQTPSDGVGPSINRTPQSQGPPGFGDPNNQNPLNGDGPSTTRPNDNVPPPRVEQTEVVDTKPKDTTTPEDTTPPPPVIPDVKNNFDDYDKDTRFNPGNLDKIESNAEAALAANIANFDVESFRMTAEDAPLEYRKSGTYKGSLAEKYNKKVAAEYNNEVAKGTAAKWVKDLAKPITKQIDNTANKPFATAVNDNGTVSFKLPDRKDRIKNDYKDSVHEAAKGLGAKAKDNNISNYVDSIKATTKKNATRLRDFKDAGDALLPTSDKSDAALREEYGFKEDIKIPQKTAPSKLSVKQSDASDRAKLKQVVLN